MGGKAFAHAAAQGHPTIRTPRMTPLQYEMLRDMLRERLQRCFPSTHVGTMIEAPEKDSYGDLDFIVASEEIVDWDCLAHQVGATAVISAAQGATMAVRLDGQSPECPRTKPIRYHISEAPSDQLTAEEYAQVDVILIKPAEYHWWKFYSSYGDLASILGFIVRKVGLTISDKGLYLRYELLDDAKKSKNFRVSDKQGMLLLSRDPSKVMQFLGLNSGRWHHGFSKMEDFFSWLVECRLLTREIIDSSKEIQYSNSRQRRRDQTRTIFPDFIHGYCETDAVLPHLCSFAGADPELKLRERRAYLQDEAVRFFGLQSEFTTHFTLFHSGLVSQQADSVLKSALALHTEKTGKKLAELVRAFRRWVVLDENGRPQISKAQIEDDESQLPKFLRRDLEELDEEKEPCLVDFIKHKWEDVKHMERHEPR